ncbi:uncharacterized protein LOC143297115 [Babylonia areolata]|uniref:uncharacterized protein LOC143297115 n=1 Tax=Babylonia areolata TaxID=304850 RepID=UPI003FD53787
MNITASSSGGTPDWTRRQGAVTPGDCVVLGVDTGGFIPWDNPDNMVSQDVEQAVDTAVGAVCLPILFLISAPTNILNMLVFWKQGLRERINLCLFYLSCVDFVHMLHAFLCNVDRFYLLVNQKGRYGPIFQFIADNGLLGFRSLTWLSGFVSMFIACERCLCVVSPLRSQTILSTKTTSLILAFTTVFTMTSALVLGLRFGVVCVFDPETNRTSRAQLTSEFYHRYQSHLDVLSLFAATVLPFIYVTVIVVTTIVTSVQLKKMVAWRQRTSSNTLSSREMVLTRMLIALSVLYIICTLPTTALGFGVIFVSDFALHGRYYNLGVSLHTVFKLAAYVNATFNFFIYCFLGTKYRDTLRRMFGYPGIGSDPL